MTAFGRALAAGFWTAAFGLAACGGSTAPPASPALPAKERAPTYPEQAPGAADEAEKKSAEPDGAAPPGATAEPEPAVAGLAQAESLLSRAETDLASSLASGDCKTICKAFASLQRAADHICELNGPDDPGGRCSKARAERDEARERVRRSCGSCA